MEKCPVCGVNMETALCSGKRGRQCLMLFCPTDGRHFRGFINDPAVVRQASESASRPPPAATKPGR